ncbi:retrovirus-related pol polyprotein from transposon TNT 1-94 [Tanacetum coccineum]
MYVAHLRSCQDKEQATSSLSLTTLVVMDLDYRAHRTPPYTPQHNGVSKRRNRTLLDMVRSMMKSQTTLPKSFWDYALESAACILNMVPTKKVEKTPYEVWHGQAPKLSYLKVWGCEALVKRDTLTKPDKLEPRSIKCIFIGYPKKKMDISFYYPPWRTKDLRCSEMPNSRECSYKSRSMCV